MLCIVTISQLQQSSSLTFPAQLFSHFIENGQECAMGGPDDNDPLILHSPFNYRNRPPRDVFWGVLYLLCLTATIIGGIVGISNR